MIITEKMENSLFSNHNPVDVKLLTRLRLKLSHLNEHKFRHDFEDTITPVCSWNTEIKVMTTTSCVAIFILLKDLNSLIILIKLTLFFFFFFFKLSATDQDNILLYGYSSNNPISLNKDITKLVINFFIKSGCFD